MRLNKYLAINTPLSRRKADIAVEQGRVIVNNSPAKIGQDIDHEDIVLLDGVPVRSITQDRKIVLLNKPEGYVSSRSGQGSKTVYDLLPQDYKGLKIAGRLDKFSSGLLILTNDGDLLYELSHPSKDKKKVYNVTIDKPLSSVAREEIGKGVQLNDGLSKMEIEPRNTTGFEWQVILEEGRNRQIRRTFAHLGYDVVVLHRISVGNFELGKLRSGEYKIFT